MKLIGLRRLKKLHFEDDSVTQELLRRWCEQGVLPARKMGDRWMVDLDRFIADFDPDTEQAANAFDYDAAAAALYGRASNS